MATDGADPPRCDQAIFDHGRCVFVTHTIGSNAIEQWVKAVARESGQRVDWHFAGGRARVLFLPAWPLSWLGRTGNHIAARRVFAAIGKLLPEHARLMAEAVRSITE